MSSRLPFNVIFLLFLALLTVSFNTSPVAAAAWRPWKRDDAPQTEIDPGFKIPLSIDSQGRYVVSIGMGKGQRAPQNLSFILSASSPYTAVADVNCPACEAQIGSGTLYDPTQSDSEEALNGTRSFQVGDANLAGHTISEACGLLASNGSFWWYLNQTVILAEDTRNLFANGAAGLIGLGRSSGSMSFVDAVFRQHKAWTSLPIGLALDPTDRNNAGYMDLHQVDSSYYDGDLHQVPVVAASSDIPTNIPADWSLTLDSWSVDTGDNRFQHTSGGVAIIEPYFPEIRLPQDQAVLFYRDLKGASMTNDSTGLTWTTPCKPTLSLSMVFGGKEFTIGPDQLITTGNNGVCQGVLKGWADVNVKSYMLGKAFAETVYLVYNATRDGNGDTISMAPRSNRPIIVHNALSKGAIAGLAVGASVAGLVIIILAFLWLRQRRAIRIRNVSASHFKYRWGAAHKRTDQKHKIEPFSPSSSSTPMLNVTSPPPGHTPWVIEHGPVGGIAMENDFGHGTGTAVGTTSGTENGSSGPRRRSSAGGFRNRKQDEAAGLTSVPVNRRPSSSNGQSEYQPLNHNQQQPTTPRTPHTPHTPMSPGSVAASHSYSQSQSQSQSQGHSLSRSQSQSQLQSSSQSGAAQSPPNTATGLLSPTATAHQSTQIHYHIHLSPEAAAGATFPPNAIIHQYGDEPAPEYEERASSFDGDAVLTNSNSSPPPTARQPHFPE